MSEDLSTARRYAPPRLSLRWRAVSPEAKALVSHCLNTVILPSLTAQQKRPSSVPAIERATEGLLGGLLVLEVAQWARRPLSASSFTEEPVSRNQFVKVLRALEAAGLIERRGGGYDRSGPVARGVETRLRLSETGRELDATHRISGSPERHFKPSATISAQSP